MQNTGILNFVPCEYAIYKTVALKLENKEM